MIARRTFPNDGKKHNPLLMILFRLTLRTQTLPTYPTLPLSFSLRSQVMRGLIDMLTKAVYFPRLGHRMPLVANYSRGQDQRMIRGNG